MQSRAPVPSSSQTRRETRRWRAVRYSDVLYVRARAPHGADRRPTSVRAAHQLTAAAEQRHPDMHACMHVQRPPATGQAAPRHASNHTHHRLTSREEHVPPARWLGRPDGRRAHMMALCVHAMRLRWSMHAKQLRRRKRPAPITASQTNDPGSGRTAIRWVSSRPRAAY